MAAAKADRTVVVAGNSNRDIAGPASNRPNRIGEKGGSPAGMWSNVSPDGAGLLQNVNKKTGRLRFQNFCEGKRPGKTGLAVCPEHYLASLER